MNWGLFIGIAQEKDDGSKNEVIQQRIEMLAEDLEVEELDLTSLFDELNHYYDKPLNLNFSSTDELKNLSFPCFSM